MSEKNYKANPDFPKLGAMVLKKEKDIEDKDSYYIKLDKDVVVTVNGKRVESLNVERPTTKYMRMLQSGKITEEEFNQKQDLYLDGEYHYIKFELSADLRPKKK